MNLNPTSPIPIIDAPKSSRFAPPVSVAITGVLVLAGTAHWATPYMSIATINLFVLLVGFTLRRRNPRAHALFMSLGIASDLALVLILQFRRHAVQTALAFKLSDWNQAHIFFSTTATALYIPMLILGIQLYRNLKNSETQDGHGSRLSLHRKLGWITLVFRTLGFFLMFSMLNKSS